MTPQNLSKPEKLLTPAQVARRFAVDPKTVTRWARAGLLPSIVTPGGHRRYRESVVDSLAQERVEKPYERSEQ
jgi:excisionase family DNA binding protein